jgi:hypothetical protein
LVLGDWWRGSHFPLTSIKEKAMKDLWETIRQAVVLAAGEGRRLEPPTRHSSTFAFAVICGLCVSAVE